MSEESQENKPIEPEGRAISRYNAIKHSILRESVTEYEKANAQQIYNELADELKPIGRLQELAVELIASNMVRLTRISKAESEAIRQELHPVMPSLDLTHLSPDKNAYEAKMSYGTMERLELYGRYQTATENRIHRLIALLRFLKGYENTEDNK